MQPDEPLDDAYDPTEHAVHDEDPELLEKLPALHAKHDEEPLLEYQPAEHVGHPEAPVPDQVPAEHVEHDDEYAPLYVPAGHTLFTFEEHEYPAVQPRQT